MGQSTDGQICYGIAFPDGFSFPWDDHEKWWREVNGYKHPFKLYNNDESGYIGGVRDEKKIDAYYDHQHAWDKEHPFPVELVNYCSGDCPMYILAVKETCKNNSRGYPEKFNPAELKVTEEQKQSLLDFCNKYLGEKISEHNNDEYISEDNKIVLEPEWYLTSYWG